MTTILIVDDNPDIVMMLRTVLEQQGYRVISARHGAEGLTVLAGRDASPDLILSNLMMPQMDGITFLQAVREDARFQETPFVMMTAAPSMGRLTEAMAMGATDFLPKPFRFDLLNRMLNHLGIRPGVN